MRLRVLGTGAGGGTPGRGRSGRRESSLLISDGTALLVDVTRDFAAQAEHLVGIDAILEAILLTHRHRDAIGGLPSLRRWWLEQNSSRPIDVFLGDAAARIIQV